jgi:hypothetical protein
MRFEKVKAKGHQEMEKIHIEAPCELFVLCDPNHRPVIRIVRASGQTGTKTRAEPIAKYTVG